MARAAKQLEPFDRAVASILRTVSEMKGVSRRELANRADLGLNRVGIILRALPPAATVGEAARIANALGLPASQLFTEAERLADLLAEPDQPDPQPDTDDDGADHGERP